MHIVKKASQPTPWPKDEAELTCQRSKSVFDSSSNESMRYVWAYLVQVCMKISAHRDAI